MEQGYSDAYLPRRQNTLSVGMFVSRAGEVTIETILYQIAMPG